MVALYTNFSLLGIHLIGGRSRVIIETLSASEDAPLPTHPMHPVAWPWLKRVKDGLDSGLVAAHSVAELYAVFTTLPIRPRITPTVALQLTPSS